MCVFVGGVAYEVPETRFHFGVLFYFDSCTAYTSNYSIDALVSFACYPWDSMLLTYSEKYS